MFWAQRFYIILPLQVQIQGILNMLSVQQTAVFTVYSSYAQPKLV